MSLGGVLLRRQEVAVSEGGAEGAGAAVDFDRQEAAAEGPSEGALAGGRKPEKGPPEGATDRDGPQKVAEPPKEAEEADLDEPHGEAEELAD